MRPPHSLRFGHAYGAQVAPVRNPDGTGNACISFRGASRQLPTKVSPVASFTPAHNYSQSPSRGLETTHHVKKSECGLASL